MDEIDYSRAIGRIERFTAILGAVGAVAVALLFGPAHAMGFAAGSLLAFLSFLLIKRMANALSPGSEQPSRRSTALGLAFRYLVIATAVFAIMKYTGIGAWPVFAGLMTTVAAVIAEIVYELVSA
jgi:hypothetical protein